MSQAWAYIPADATAAKEAVIDHFQLIGQEAKSGLLFFLVALVCILVLKRFARRVT
jgi:hypothetical protein